MGNCIRTLGCRGVGLNGWLQLRAKPPAERRVAVLVYGFPPNVGATGTAALLDVPRTLDALFARLRAEGSRKNVLPGNSRGVVPQRHSSVRVTEGFEADREASTEVFKFV